MINGLPFSKSRPNRPLDKADIILVKDFTFRGKPMKPHYFMVVESGDDLKTPEGYHYDVACLPMCALRDPDKAPDLQLVSDDEANTEIPNNYLVWYTDMPVKDVYKTDSVLVNTTLLQSHMFQEKHHLRQRNSIHRDLNFLRQVQP